MGGRGGVAGADYKLSVILYFTLTMKYLILVIIMGVYFQCKPANPPQSATVAEAPAAHKYYDTAIIIDDSTPIVFDKLELDLTCERLRAPKGMWEKCSSWEMSLETAEKMIRTFKPLPYQEFEAHYTPSDCIYKGNVYVGHTQYYLNINGGGYIVLALEDTAYFFGEDGHQFDKYFLTKHR